MNPTMRFATRNFLGKPRDFYFVEERQIPASQVSKVPAVSDLIVVLDESGSMWGDNDSMKTMLCKVFAVSEYRDANLRVTVISYSSRGDVIAHFELVKIGDIMAAGSKYEAAIRKLQVRGLTCISQGLRAARDVAARATKDGGTVAVTLMSDGWANDSSPTAEKREIAEIVESFRGLDNVFCSTIAFRSSSDFQLLAGIANALSGSCIQAQDVKQVYDTIYDAAKLLAGKTAPALKLDLGDYTRQVFVSRSAKRVLGSSEDLVVRGLTADDDRTVYLFKQIDEKKWRGSKLTEAPLAVCYTFARAMLAEGALNAAKYAVVTSRNATLFDRHAKALTGEQVAALAADLDRVIFDDVPSDVITKTYGFVNPATSVLDLCQTLGEHADGFEVNVAALVAGYRRRGLKRLLGRRGDDGKVVPPRFTTERRDDGPYARTGGFEVNRNTATINLMVMQPVTLVARDTKRPVKEVAGIKLDRLTDYRQYTVVGDGALNVSALPIRISDKRLWKALEEIGAVEGAYSPTREYAIDLASRPLVAYDARFDAEALRGLPERAHKLRIASSILTALLKESSARFTAEQVQALREHCLTEKLYVNFPTTVPYADEAGAIAKGEVDYRVSFKVNLGEVEALSPSAFYSANEFLARWYACAGVADPKKPKWAEWWRADFGASHKDRSKLRSITKVDDLMAEVFDDFLGVKKTGAVEAIARDAGLKAADVRAVRKALDRKATEDEATAALADFRKAIDRAVDDLFRREVGPLVFYVGATGLLPDDFGDLRAMTAEQFAAKYPKASLTKDEREATFYALGDVVLSIFAKSEPYSTEAGVKAAKAQQSELEAA